MTLAGERLIVWPASRVPAVLAAAIRAHKPALVAYLRSRPVCAECCQPIIEGATAWYGGDPVHRACGERAWRRDWRTKAPHAQEVAA